METKAGNTLDSSSHPEQWYRDPRVAACYDQARFTSWSGRRGDLKEKRAFRQVLQRAGTVSRALDVPCGTGRMTEVLLECSAGHVTGCDLSAEMMSHAEGKLARYCDRLELVEGDIKALPFEDGTFDLVSCVRLFGHFPTELRSAILCEMKRVSRRWVIVQYFYETPLTRLKRTVKRHILKSYEGVRYPVCAAMLADEIRSAGLNECARAWCRKYYSEEVFLLLGTG